MPVATQAGPPRDDASQTHIEIIVKTVAAVCHTMSALHTIDTTTPTHKKMTSQKTFLPK